MSIEFSPSLDILDPSYRDAWAVKPLAEKLSRLVARKLPTRPLSMRNTVPMVTFTFDDVPVSACTFGAPVLERFGGRATFYVSGGGCGSIGPCGPLATSDQVREMRMRGHEIGCHTYSHPAVSRVAADELRAELDRSARFLSGIDQAISVRNFAYPYGDFSWRSKRIVEAQFESCRSLMPGLNANVVDLGLLKSFGLADAMLDRAAIGHLIAETVRLRGWLIFCGHDVGDRPSQFGVSPGLLEYAVGTAQAKGCRLVTVAEGLDLAGARR